MRIDGDGWQEALELYQAQRDDLHLGRTPQSTPNQAGDGQLVLKDLCNSFLTAKKRKRDAGELSALTFQEYEQFAVMLAEAFGKTRPVDDLRPANFGALRAALAKKAGP